MSIAVWVIIGVSALIIDILTAGFFAAGFTIGGVFAIIAGILGYNFLVQFIVFSIISALSIYVEYQWLRKKLKKSIPKTLTMEEEYIGKHIKIEDDIHESGRIKLGGIYWSVENQGEPVKKGESAEIIGIKGNKLIIRKQGV